MTHADDADDDEDENDDDDTLVDDNWRTLVEAPGLGHPPSNTVGIDPHRDDTRRHEYLANALQVDFAACYYPATTFLFEFQIYF